MEKLVKRESNPSRLAWSITLGIFLAFSPYVGLQTVLAFVLSYLLWANSAVVLIVLYTVSNPWTMIPIAAFDYMFGHWLVESVLGWNLEQYNPSWMEWVNNKISGITSYLGIESICFWCFMIGGNIIAITFAAASYPFLKNMCVRIINKYSTDDREIQEAHVTKK